VWRTPAIVARLLEAAKQADPAHQSEIRRRIHAAHGQADVPEDIDILQVKQTWLRVMKMARRSCGP
jgi:hypothetical protein